MLDVDFAQIILRLVQLLLNLLILLFLVSLRLKILIQELSWGDFVIDVQLAHQKTLFSKLVLLVLMVTHSVRFIIN